MSYIELRQICKSYDDSQMILKQVSLSIEKGEFVTLLGSSGCGKTTLLRSIAGLETVDEGEILIDGVDVTHLNPRQRNLAMIFQQHSLFPTMTVQENVAFGLKMKKIPRPQIYQRVQDTLELVDLSGSEKKYPSQLSGGEQQRVALARCIVTNPKVLLLDEPFSAIDAKLRRALQIKIKEIHTELGITSIFVTHDQEEAMRMSDRIYLMNEGRIEQSDTPMNLYLHPVSSYAAGFIGHYNMIPASAWSALVSCPDCDGWYAVRPENIEISAVPTQQKEDAFLLSGTIRQVIYQGNVVRYTVELPGFELDIDQLYEGQRSYGRGEIINMSIDTKRVIHYA
ncbi:MAG: ABC transporter ATP-binding protein [Clostridiaceae bacterium]|nr:ABC transporter ATP-binding protein [Clostridiaceae bacterium]